MKSSSAVLAVFYVLGAGFVCYAGLSMFEAINAVIASIPVIR